MERQTRQRQAVLDALAGSGRTLSPPDILNLAQVQAPRLNLSTVYRQIKVLEETGEVVRVQLPGLPARFEARCAHPADAVVRGLDSDDHAQHAHAHHHHHFHCLSCDQVVPIHGCPGPMDELAPAGCLVERHDLVLHGRCARCATGAPA
jgi:Fur family ferric uptake transcriptional regulator